MPEGCDGCNALFEGIPKGCENNIGGIKRLWLTEKCNVDSLTLGSPTDFIETITMDGGALFYEFEFNKNSSTYTEVTKAVPENGSQVSEQTITLKLARREKSKRDTLALIGMFKDLVAVVEDNNSGVLWYFGETNGLNMTENNSGPGTAKSDFNGYTITLFGEEPEQANTLENAAVIEAVV